MVVSRTTPTRVQSTPSSAPVAPRSSSADAREITMVALGDSLTAGTQDAVTRSSRQNMAYTRQLARAAGIPFNMPEVSEPGIPFEVFGSTNIDLDHFARGKKLLMAALAPLAAWTYYLGVPPFFYPPVGEMLGAGRRVPESRNSEERPQHSFAIAGFEARHLHQVHNTRDFLELIHNRTEDVGTLASQIPLIKATLQDGGLRSAGSQLDQAIAADPDLVVLWGGANDALEAAFRGYIDDRTLTPVDDRVWQFRDPGLTATGDWVTTSEPVTGFRSTFVGPDGLLTRLTKETDAEVMLLNVPNVGVIPNLIELGRPVGPLPFRILLKDGTDVTSDIERMVVPRDIKGEGQNGRSRFPAGTQVPLMTLLGKLVAEGPLETLQSFKNALFKAQVGGFLTEDEALDPSEIARIQRRVDEFNEILREAAESDPRLHLVDVHQVLNDIQANGHTLRGGGAEEIVVTTTFTGTRDGRGMGGMFSFDGVHPSNTGHAMVGNLVLDRIREDLGEDPRFAGMVQAPPIDEKQVYREDPNHDGHRQALILDRTTIQSLRLGCR